MEPCNVVVLIGGGHASGKRTTALWIEKEIRKLAESVPTIEVIDMNTYMDPTAVTKLTESNTSAITVGNKTLLALKPSRFDFQALKEHIRTSLSETTSSSQKLIIVHGLYALYDKELRDMSQIKVFIGGDNDTRLIRWIRRDVLGSEGHSLETIINSYLHGAKQEMSDYIFPTKEQADVIMPRGAEQNAVSLIVDGILPYLGSERMEPSSSNILRPHDKSFQTERFDNQKGKYYELN